MKNEYKKYLYAGITAFAVIAASILLFFCIDRLPFIKKGFGMICTILMPIIYGAVIAYLLNPIYNFLYAKIRPFLERYVQKGKKAIAFSKGISTLISVFIMLIIIGGLLWLVIPQVVESIMGIVDNMQKDYITSIANWLQDLFKNNPEVEKTVMELYQKSTSLLEGWLSTDLVPNLESMITGLSSGVITVLNLLKNLLIGIIVAVYILNSKEVFAAQSKKIFYTIAPLPAANNIIREIRIANKIFGGFLSGKLLDSLIIGIICFVVISFLKLPYVMLISVVIGVTNIIPFFGPFIGAVPCALLVLLVSPIKCLTFIIFVLILQQFDGNILGPKILGDSTGLPSFWVLFSILLFGGLFGFVGMIIGVPTFAYIYHLINIWTVRTLAKKHLPTKTDAYKDVGYVDPDDKKFMK